MHARLKSSAKVVLGIALSAAVMVVAGPSASETAGAATSQADCGAQILKPDGTPWVCTFADDFNGSALDRTKWTPQLTATSGYHSGAECFVDTPDNIAVANGELKLTLLKTPSPFYCADPAGNYATQFTSGMVTTYSKFTQAGGRFEMRAKFPGGDRPGLQSSLWMWPQTLAAAAWPYSGEIDIAEWYSQYPTRVVPYVHESLDFWDPQHTNTNCIIANVNDWQTYTVVWNSTGITISYDGNTCITSTSWAAYRALGYSPFDKPFMLAITQMLGVGPNVANPWLPPTLPASTEVDYVRAWS
jgi:beta-glucanase (GH16 family)